MSMEQKPRTSGRGAVTEVMLPYPVSANRYWRNCGGRMIRSLAASLYKSQAGLLARAAGMKVPLDGPVELTIDLHPVEPGDADKRAARDPHWYRSVRCIDLDNALKVTIDALNGIAYRDDRQIEALMVSKAMPIPGGGVRVRVRTL